MTVFYLALGANQNSPHGSPRQTLEAAMSCLSQHLCIEGLEIGPWYRSAPLDSAGDWYWNTVVRAYWRGPEGEVGARLLLGLTQGIEQALGRDRSTVERPALAQPRPIDIDLLLFGELVLNSLELTLPHPRMVDRAFVLQPLLAFDAFVEIPGRGRAAAFLPALSGQGLQRIE